MLYDLAPAYSDQYLITANFGDNFYIGVPNETIQANEILEVVEDTQEVINFKAGNDFTYFNGYFYFHTWPEVWLDKWVPADPAFAQFPADVTHIPLKQGTLEEIISIIDDLRDIEIEIMEAI